MENLVDDLNALISPIYDLWGSFQAKFMQMKTFRSDFSNFQKVRELGFFGQQKAYLSLSAFCKH